MEQHPVPQNVTTFQFRLIGDMTLKQFGYLAAGAILAYIAYKLPLPFLITYPLAGVLGLLGFGFAFVPVEERPMDVWVFSFFKSIYAPTQYIWQKGKPVEPAAARVPPPPAPVAAPTPAAPPVADIPAQTKSVVAQLFDKRASAIARAPQIAPAHADPFGWLTRLLRPTPKAAPPPQPAPVMYASPVPAVTGVHVDVPPQPQAPSAPAATPASAAPSNNDAEKLESQIEELTQKLSTHEASEARILELQKQLTDLLAEKDKMQNELLLMKQRASRPPFSPLRAAPSPFSQTPPPQPAPRSSATGQSGVGPTVRVITQDAAVKAGLPRLTSVPNIVTGITKDNQGNFLPGVLVTIRDKDEMPLRALKTNKLGQFAASTPLPNGTYVVEVEDPRGRYIFDRAQVTLNGGVLAPLEMTAKSQKELTRDKLAAEIFGKTDI